MTNTTNTQMVKHLETGQHVALRTPSGRPSKSPWKRGIVQEVNRPSRRALVLFSLSPEERRATGASQERQWFRYEELAPVTTP